MFAYVYDGGRVPLYRASPERLIGEDSRIEGPVPAQPRRAVLLLILCFLRRHPADRRLHGASIYFFSLIESSILCSGLRLSVICPAYYYFRVLVHAWLKQRRSPRGHDKRRPSRRWTVFVSLPSLYPARSQNRTLCFGSKPKKGSSHSIAEKARTSRTGCDRDGIPSCCPGRRCGGSGYFLDRLLHTKPWLLSCLGIVFTLRAQCPPALSEPAE